MIKKVFEITLHDDDINIISDDMQYATLYNLSGTQTNCDEKTNEKIKSVCQEIHGKVLELSRLLSENIIPENFATSK